MEQNTIENRIMDVASPKEPTRDAEILVLFWEAFRARGNEIDSLLDLSLSILSSASDFPQKEDLETTLKKALSLVRTID